MSGSGSGIGSHNKNCLVLPHGGYALLVATICTLAWSAALFQDGCDFARVQGPVVEGLLKASSSKESDSTTATTPLIIPPWLEFGIGAYRSPIFVESTQQWETSFDEPCQLYPSDYKDAPWTTTRAFDFLALVMGGAGTLFLWLCSTCFVFGKATWRWTGYELLLASLCQSLTTVWFSTSICRWNTCQLFWGSKADIAAATLWCIAGILIVCRYPTPKTTTWHDDDDDHDDDHDDHDDHGEENEAEDLALSSNVGDEGDEEQQHPMVVVVGGGDEAEFTPVANAEMT
jgi:hypothetical protein